MRFVDGKPEKGTKEVALYLKVSEKTVRNYIRKGTIPPPPKMKQGTRDFNDFPEKYLEEAKKSLNRSKGVGGVEQLTVEQRVQQICEDAQRHATKRLSRGSLLIQKGAYASHREWEERRKLHPEKIARLNKLLK